VSLIRARRTARMLYQQRSRVTIATRRKARPLASKYRQLFLPYLSPKQTTNH